MNEVWMVIDDYTPDAGSTIYGIYTDYHLATCMLRLLEDPDNAYGCNMNKEDTIEIRSVTLDEVGL